MARRTNIIGWSLCALALAGCGDKDDDSAAPAGDDGAVACGSTQAFASGFITGAAAPTLAARRSEDGLEVTAHWYGDATDEGVPYEINLEEGSWVLSASADGCATDSGVLNAVACSEYTLSFDLTCR